MNVYKVTLFGHRTLYAYKKLEQRLRPILQYLMRTKEYVEFYIGRNGDFDIFAASIVKQVQRACGGENSSMTLVLPYPEKNMEDYMRYYDDVLIPECLEKIHPKGAIGKRNRWLVEECDLLICYVEREIGGAYTALQYAKALGKEVRNLANDADYEDVE